MKKVKIPVIDMVKGNRVGFAKPKKIDGKVIGYNILKDDGSVEFADKGNVEKIGDALLLIPEWQREAQRVVDLIKKYSEKYPEVLYKGDINDVEELKKFRKYATHTLVMLIEREAMLEEAENEILGKISRILALRSINKMGIIEFSKNMEELERKHGIIEMNLKRCEEYRKTIEESPFANLKQLEDKVKLRKIIRNFISKGGTYE